MKIIVAVPCHEVVGSSHVVTNKKKGNFEKKALNQINYSGCIWPVQSFNWALLCSLFLNMLLNTVYAAKEDSLFWIMVHQTSKNVSHATLHFYPAISPWVVGTAKRMSNVKFQLFPRGLAKWLKNLLSLMLSRISLGLDILAHMAVTSRLHLPLTHNLPPYLLYQ